MVKLLEAGIAIMLNNAVHIILQRKSINSRNQRPMLRQVQQNQFLLINESVTEIFSDSRSKFYLQKLTCCTSNL